MYMFHFHSLFCPILLPPPNQGHINLVAFKEVFLTSTHLCIVMVS